MTKQNGTFNSVIGAGMIAAAFALAPSTANAVPDKPLNAATTDSGQFCIVRASESDPYVADPNCEWHTVTKNDKDGNPVSFRYQDKGDLQPGQTAPDRAVKMEITNFPGCTGSEVVTPSGKYSSDLTCKF
jgi:hypothetical protein